MRRDLSEEGKRDAIFRMEEYCRSVIEKPAAAFGNKPPCPFSRREREESRIRYEFFAILPIGPSDDVVAVVKDFFAAGQHTTLLVIDPETAVTVAEGVQYGRELSRRCQEQKIVAISVHPDDDFAIDGFRPRRGIPYVTMLCQAAQYLLDAKKQLEGTDYYCKWTRAALDYNFQQIGEFL
ncbi:MAG TPA: hypothetical protein VHC22_19600 [Pirellulales bacterium]|nr:hypothetical protein [Pirellulales bacterium]